MLVRWPCTNHGRIRTCVPALDGLEWLQDPDNHVGPFSTYRNMSRTTRGAPPNGTNFRNGRTSSQHSGSNSSALYSAPEIGIAKYQIAVTMNNTSFLTETGSCPSWPPPIGRVVSLVQARTVWTLIGYTRWAFRAWVLSHALYWSLPMQLMDTWWTYFHWWPISDRPWTSNLKKVIGLSL